MTVEEYVSRLTPQDMALKWQTFLTDGFEDWWPAATLAAYQTVKPDPPAVLQAMISRFLFPENIQQSTEDITAALERIAISHNARVRDPKTGKIIGTMRDLKKANKPPRPDPTKKRFKRKRKL